VSSFQQSKFLAVCFIFYVAQRFAPVFSVFYAVGVSGLHFSSAS